MISILAILYAFSKSEIILHLLHIQYLCIYPILYKSGIVVGTYYEMLDLQKAQAPG